jgi:hypothetical protein
VFEDVLKSFRNKNLDLHYSVCIQALPEDRPHLVYTIQVAQSRHLQIRGVTVTPVLRAIRSAEAARKFSVTLEETNTAVGIYLLLPKTKRST